jgi:hypothetical protein
MRLKLGKRDARPARGLLYGAIFNPDMLPMPPKIFGHELLLASGAWGMLGNDQAGDCTLCDAAHQTMLWSLEGIKKPVPFTTAGVIADYSAISGYNGTEATDTGCDIQDVAAYRQKTGVIDANSVRHKIQNFASLKVGNLTQLAQAAYIFGAVSVGVQLPSSAEQQFDDGMPWSVVPGDGSEGGHCITIVGKNSVGNFLLITWGRLHAATPAWLAAYMDEAIAPLSLEMLNAKGVSPEAYDLPTLTKYQGEF